MLTEAKVDSALKKLADIFLDELRTRAGSSRLAGWGQFIGQRNRTQIGLYGTSAGLISVALAYGPNRVPASVIEYLASLWNERHTSGSDGARYFALTARRAFFLMALRQCKHPSLQSITAEADRELRERILPDGFFVGWQIDALNRGPTGNETATCLAILAYALTGPKSEIPPEIQRAANVLQARLDGAPSSNTGLRKFSLCSLSLALDSRSLRPHIKQLIAQSRITPDTRGQDTLDFWDYDFKIAEGSASRRDYLHVPADAVDILLACGEQSDKNQRRAALSLADEAATSFIDAGLYFGGRDKATSKSQAWVALAVEHSKILLRPQADRKTAVRGWFQFLRT
jgi:hypothetical protein